jgi:protein SCO1/2
MTPNPSTNPALSLIATLLCILGSTPAIAAENPWQDQIPDTAEAPTGGDFTLDSYRGPVSLHDFKGKVVMLYFGYTSCPDVCPTSLGYMVAALGELSPDELQQVQPIFISVDPERDSLQGLKDYVEYFQPGFIGLTGSEEQVAQVAKQYGAKYYPVELEGSAFGYAINHSAAIYLIDQDGTLRFAFPHKTPASVMTDAMQHLLKGN